MLFCGEALTIPRSASFEVTRLNPHFRKEDPVPPESTYPSCHSEGLNMCMSSTDLSPCYHAMNKYLRTSVFLHIPFSTSPLAYLRGHAHSCQLMQPTRNLLWPLGGLPIAPTTSKLYGVHAVLGTALPIDWGGRGE